MKAIHSENPEEHWSDISDVDGKVVMDLGCGWLFQSFMSTPEYFISRGASKVIGVDVSCGEIEKLRELYPNHTFICTAIESSEDLMDLIKNYKPQVIKMDIEGYEKIIAEIPTHYFDTIEEIAVEYHNPECKRIVEEGMIRIGFEITTINNFGWYVTDVNYMGVLHAKKQ